MRQTWTVIGGLVLATSAVYAQATSSQTVTYEAITATSPVGISRLRVTQVEDYAYAVDFSIIAPNRTQHTGHIQGYAAREGTRLTLKVPNFQPDGSIDYPALCTLVIYLSETRAQVANETDCAGFHGAGASFLEQGRDLVRVP